MVRTIKISLTIAMLISVICLFSSCDENKKTNHENTTTLIAEIPDSVIVSATQNNISETQETSSNNRETEGVGGGIITVQKYRHRFYSVPGPFVDLIGKEGFFEWRETVDMTSTAETMVMSQFIQHFGITREQFDKANLEYAKRIRNKLSGTPCINPKDYANQEDDEIFNADIIFTFDDNLIREYYLSPEYPYLYDFEFEDAVANGEYTPQTEEWVDIEQMEADIIAKYGEAGIVTTVSAEETPTEEIAVEESTEAVTDIPETTSANETSNIAE